MNMSYDHPCICMQPSQFANGCMGEVDIIVHKKPNKGIVPILIIQHSKNLHLDREMKADTYLASEFGGMW